MGAPGKPPTGRAGEATHLAVYVTPRAGRTEIAGEREGAVWVRLAAPPVDGAANEALLAYLAKQLAVPRTALRLVAGQSSRQKRIAIAGLDVGAVRARLGFKGGPASPTPPTRAIPG